MEDTAHGMRYEVDARYSPNSFAVFKAFDGEGRTAAFAFARTLHEQNFGWVRIQQASVWSGPRDWTRVVWERERSAS